MRTDYLMSVEEVMDFLGVSRNKAYEVINEFNNELKSKNFFTYPGKVPRPFFEEKCYGYKSIVKPI